MGGGETASTTHDGFARKESTLTEISRVENTNGETNKRNKKVVKETIMIEECEGWGEGVEEEIQEKKKKD